VTELALIDALQQAKKKSSPVEIKQEPLTLVKVTRPVIGNRNIDINKSGTGKKCVQESTIEIDDTDAELTLPILSAPSLPALKKHKVQSKFDRVVTSFPLGMN